MRCGCIFNFPCPSFFHLAVLLYLHPRLRSCPVQVDSRREMFCQISELYCTKFMLNFRYVFEIWSKFQLNRTCFQVFKKIKVIP